VRLADEFLKENKPLVKKQELPLGDAVVHTAGRAYFSWGRFETVRRHIIRVEADSLDGTTIRMPKGKMQPYLYLLSTFETRHRMVKDDKRLSCGVPLAEFIRGLGRKKVLTNKGRLSFNDLADSTSKPHLLLYSDPAIAEHFSQRDDLMVFGDADLLFELAVFLTYHGTKFHTGFSGHDEFKRFGEPKKLYVYEFVSYSNYEKLVDSEILYSVIHVVNSVRDERLGELFLNAARWSKNAEEITKMRKHVLSLDAQVSK
jgi:hypothetical protein